MDIQIQDNQLLITVDKSIYDMNVLHKCFYWYGANYEAEIADHSATAYQITLTAKTEPLNPEELIEKVKRDLIDFKLRQIVTDETKTIRELLIAKAFTYYDEENNPATEISDPVGFDPLSI